MHESYRLRFSNLNPFTGEDCLGYSFRVRSALLQDEYARRDLPDSLGLNLRATILRVYEIGLAVGIATTGLQALLN